MMAPASAAIAMATGSPSHGETPKCTYSAAVV
jgi:hypothetical protein